MAHEGASKEDIWHQIDSSVASLVGQRVFYNHNGKKVLAFVIGAGFERDANGHIQNQLIIFPPGEGVKQVTSFLSSDRIVGSFDIAQPGDLTDSGTVPKKPAEVTEEVAQEPAPLPHLQAAQEFDPADSNKDGVVTKQERKQHLKGGN